MISHNCLIFHVPGLYTVIAAQPVFTRTAWSRTAYTQAHVEQIFVFSVVPPSADCRLPSLIRKFKKINKSLYHSVRNAIQSTATGSGIFTMPHSATLLQRYTRRTVRSTHGTCFWPNLTGKKLETKIIGSDSDEIIIYFSCLSHAYRALPIYCRGACDKRKLKFSDSNLFLVGWREMGFRVSDPMINMVRNPRDVRVFVPIKTRDRI